MAIALGAAASLGAQALGAQEGAAAVPPSSFPLATFLDSAALHASLTRLPSRPAAKQTERVFVVVFDSTGQPRPPRAAVPADMPAAYRDTVGALLRAALRPIPPRPYGWRTTLLVEAGDPPRIAVVDLPIPIPQRAPRVVNRGRVGELLYAEAQALMNADRSLEGREMQARLALRIDTLGVVDSAWLVASSGLPAVDSAALRVGPAFRFTPALFDGEPIVTRVTQPIIFVFEAEEPKGKKKKRGAP